jgi:hypothetical protein
LSVGPGNEEEVRRLSVGPGNEEEVRRLSVGPGNEEEVRRLSVGPGNEEEVRRLSVGPGNEEEVRQFSVGPGNEDVLCALCVWNVGEYFFMCTLCVEFWCVFLMLVCIFFVHFVCGMLVCIFLCALCVWNFGVYFLMLNVAVVCGNFVCNFFAPLWCVILVHLFDVEFF